MLKNTIFSEISTAELTDGEIPGPSTASPLPAGRLEAAAGDREDDGRQGVHGVVDPVGGGLLPMTMGAVDRCRAPEGGGSTRVQGPPVQFLRLARGPGNSRPEP